MLPFSGAIATFLKIDPINCILEPEKDKGGLYLGNIFAAFDENILNKYQIGAVLTVAANTDLSYTNRKHKIFAVEDIESENLSKYFDEMIEFIEENRNNKINIFVHCFAGVSRSSTAIIAYLMKVNSWDFNKSLALCKRKRFVTCPNAGFTKQLKSFEGKLKISSKNKKEPNSQALVNSVNANQPKSFSQSGKQFDLMNLKKKLYNLNDLANNMNGNIGNNSNSNGNLNGNGNNQGVGINFNNLQLPKGMTLKKQAMQRKPLFKRKQNNINGGNIENQLGGNNNINNNNNDNKEEIFPPLNIQKPFYQNTMVLNQNNRFVKNQKLGKIFTAKLL